MEYEIKSKSDIDGLRCALEKIYDEEDEIERASMLLTLKNKFINCGGLVKDFDFLESSFKSQRKAFDRDRAEQEKREQQAALEAELAGVTQYSGSKYPDMKCGSWIADDKGVRYLGYAKNDKIASRYPVTWVRSMKNINSQRFKVTLAFRKRGKWSEITIDKAVISDKAKICALASFDFPVTSDTTGYLVEFLADLEFYNNSDIELVRSTTKMGWQEKKTAEFFPYSDTGLVFDGEVEFADQFKAICPTGDPDAWLEAVRKVRASGRIEPQFMAAASFASPLLAILGVQSFCVNLWGNTEGGKSVTSQLAASVWADPQPGKFMLDFQNTDVILEVRQNFLNSLPLILDDSATVKNRAFFDMSDFVYKRCKEKGKGRSDKNLGIHDDMSWRQVIIMNGEQPAVTDDMQGGAINRTLDLACGHTAIYSDPRGLIEVIHNNYGYAGKDFIELILAMDKDVIRGIFDKYVKIIDSLDGMKKQTNALAAIMTADELTEKYIFKDGVTMNLEQVAGVLSSKDFVSEDKRCYDYLIDQLVIHNDKFVPVEEKGVTAYKSECWGCVDGDYLVIIKSVFDRLCSEHNFSGKRFLNWGHANGAILPDNAGKSTKLKKFDGKPYRCVFIHLPTDTEDPEEPKIVDDNQGIPF